jgi:aminoglycoside/choline kinase family phosphotransferase
MNAGSQRHNELEHFVAARLGRSAVDIAPASADASFRSYWRVRAGTQTFIVMDAPPAQEDIGPWLDIVARLRAAGLHAPQVFASQADQGFVLMEDLGTHAYLDALNEASADALYADAVDALLRMQREVRADDLPLFDVTRTIPEMELLGPWFLDRHLGFVPDCTQWDVIEHAFRTIANALEEQPRRFMHRDYHSRNLLIAGDAQPAADGGGDWLATPAIIDFQGAMLGPISYDLASLLRDCYIAWPIERVDAWVEDCRQRLVDAAITDADARRFRRWFDLTGLQRHVRVLGLFCRLCYRDAKPGYLADLPRVLAYVLDVARLYPDLVAFADLLERAVDGRDIAQPRALPAAASA